MTRTRNSIETWASAAFPTVSLVAQGCRAAPGYDPEVLATLPRESVAGSSGCGDPVGRSDLLVGDVVLDLGSGTGIDLVLAARKVGPSGYVFGIDRSPRMVAAARAVIGAAGIRNVKVCEGRIEALPHPTGSIDWVLANCAVNAAVDKRKVFAEIQRVLKPGGQTRIADVFTAGLPARDDSGMALVGSCLAGATDEADYIVGLAAAGLTDIAIGGRYVYDQRQLAAMVPARLGSAAGAFPATEAAEAAVGGIWRAYLYAQKPYRNRAAGAWSNRKQAEPRRLGPAERNNHDAEPRNRGSRLPSEP